MVMARREVLVQLEDDLVVALDRIAKEQNTNRSELLRRLATSLVKTDDEIKADAELVEAYRRQPQDPAMTEAFMRLAAENAIDW
jgi:metal-responsive CopG/Arc/MetJ family transcriptional regulator